ncbi:T9SS type A sorting domain-containing protein [Olleya sp. YS]|uniref:T9SS type A sorting domain-containing protein n=1 Tax=Olleya sp. YS TaxID=3028318 RepID=UPI0024343D24|nr:T9SS type A sorting domain-containing protein [Olleya sp. YS]WGD34252.1 T9SS type A sorting domain-containing protein [Olleya sp. YS]
MKKITFLLFMLTASFGFSQAPTVDPTTPPARDAADVVSIFSGEYSNIAGADYNPNWGQSGFGSADTAYQPTGAGGSGNVVLAYPNLNYQGIDYNGAQNVSAMEFLHVDIWTDGVAPNIYIISPGPVETAYAIPNVSGSWQSIDIPLSSFSPVDLTNVIQFKFDGGTGTEAIYVDNLYFWKNPTAAGTDATLSDLQVDNATVSGFIPSVTDYTVGLPGGTTVIPQITMATTNDTNATVTSITQATSIPGDATVLVTAQDGTTTNTYTVSFALTSPGAPAPTPPARDPLDVISIFADPAYANVPNVNYNPNWGQSGFGTANPSYDVANSGDLAIHYPNFNYQGIDFNGAQDISAMEFLHLDIWIAGSFSPNVYVISSGAEIAHPITNSGSGDWHSVDIPVAGITGDLTNAIQFKFDGGSGTDEIFVDNLYFWKNPTVSGSDATLSDLQVDGATVTGFNPNTVSYTLGYPEGTTTVPQITMATTTDTNATITSITQATAIPGSATVLVTAQDGTTTSTYTVNYAITSPSSAAPTPPSRNASDVVSIFSDAYANVGLDELPTTWSQTGFEAITLEGTNNAWKLTGCEFLGIVTNYANGVDLSQMEMMHIDYWTPDSNEIFVKLVNTIANPVEEDIESLGATITGSWQSVEVDMTGFAARSSQAVTLDQITQILIDPTAPSLVYIDNFYFYKGTALSTDEFNTTDFKVYPNPTSSEWNISSDQNINSIVLFDVLGKQVLTLTPNASKVTINSSALNTGLYFAKLSSDNGSKTVKLIKE